MPLSAAIAATYVADVSSPKTGDEEAEEVGAGVVTCQIAALTKECALSHSS
jgi:hypothetical protein